MSADKGQYLPLHELHAQPSLVKGGIMKDYQVRACDVMAFLVLRADCMRSVLSQLHGLSFLVWMYQNGMNCILGDECVEFSLWYDRHSCS